MFVVVVQVHVKTEHVDAFIAATRDNHLGTRQEPGNVRFDVLRRNDDPKRFALYEVYVSETDFTAHQKTSHYLRWRETVAPMMEEARTAQKFSSLQPDPWT